MKLMELYFKAFRAFRKQTKDDETSQKLRTAIIHSNREDQIFTTIKYECKIDEEWVENIEEGLIYVEKAINEDRQFIRTEGEVVPIEKVKKVSKTSIEHLSKHSNFITRKPKDSSVGVIPEKLYIVEKLSDYLVYENRFLYLLLCYVKDFIEIRLDKIKDKTTTYQSQMSIDKNIEETNRNVQYKLEYQDLIKNDPFLQEQFSEIPLVKRVETIYAVAVSLLATPLMKAVAKAPLIKPPITKTNVLRMNQNFKASLKLYDYITSYSGEGYEILEAKNTFQPLSDVMGDELAETIELTSVIGYLEGNDIRDMLNKQMEQEEKEKQELKNQKKKEEIRRLKRRIIEMDEDPAEYILTLEKRNAKLEKKSMSLDEEIEKNNELSIRISELKNEQLELHQSIGNLNTQILNKNTEIDLMNQKYFDDMTEAEHVHEQEMNTLKQHHQDNIEDINSAHQKDKAELVEFYEQEQQEQKRAFENERNYIIERNDIRAKLYDDNIVKLEKDIESLEGEITDFVVQITNLESDSKQYQDDRDFARGQYVALKAQQGLLTEEDDFTSRKRFKQLEQERRAYNKLFKQQWKLTKKRIREEMKQKSIEELKSKSKK